MPARPPSQILLSTQQIQARVAEMAEILVAADPKARLKEIKRLLQAL